ncbi:MAG: DNA repair protein RecO [Firmicutes bacterium]|nr:DNA repair protein RecO [Bacillota bacterium]MBQ2058894.1 DNA repair protein RecO [Bacillota bacterium]MBQ4370798.1 DNA repair protein RecO [Bacillota bacterium]
MNTESEGIVLRQTKTVGGRTMITLFSERFGKISAGTSVSERSKSRAALALRPFCCGRYQLYSLRGSYSITGTETVNSFMRLGDDLDRYLAASYVLELTDAMIGEDSPQPAIYRLLKESLGMLEERKKAWDTIVIAYQIKCLDALGSGPDLSSCVRCGRDLSDPSGEEKLWFSVGDGGLICDSCKASQELPQGLIFEVDTDIIRALSYMRSHPLSSLSRLALEDRIAGQLRKMLSAYISFHLGIEGLKSEGLRI